MEEEHRAIHIYHRTHPSHSQLSNSVDSGSMCRTMTDTPKNVTFNPQVMTMNTTGFQKRYLPPRWFQVFRNKNKSSLPPLPVVSVGTCASSKTILSTKRHSTDDIIDKCFSRTEALPLLKDLSNNVFSERTRSPNYIRKKKYVYPSDIIVMSQHTKESSV